MVGVLGGMRVHLPLTERGARARIAREWREHGTYHGGRTRRNNVDARNAPL